eukprot:TRINITY_DN31337_c0_g1_i1.p1 TRINITY_DN31337_c0_g1~~TRINITY_DN31337_c0_g1_i1.p1  ORF type:complete len:226 (-),score=28.22 TRINITY_DN31337_c0_g1_i1:98-718(-)
MCIRDRRKRTDLHFHRLSPGLYLFLAKIDMSSTQTLITHETARGSTAIYNMPKNSATPHPALQTLISNYPSFLRSPYSVDRGTNVSYKGSYSTETSTAPTSHQSSIVFRHDKHERLFSEDLYRTSTKEPLHYHSPEELPRLNLHGVGFKTVPPPDEENRRGIIKLQRVEMESEPDEEELFCGIKVKKSTAKNNKKDDEETEGCNLI